MSHWTKSPGKWKDNPKDAFIRTDAQVTAMNEKAMPAYEIAKAKAAAALNTATISKVFHVTT